MIAPGTTEAVVLCAGAGKRLAPLTDRIPKVLVPVGGEPLLGHHLSALRSVGIRRAVLVVGHTSSAVREFLGSRSNFGLEIKYCEQPEPLGTGDAVRRGAAMVGSDPFLVVYADVFSPSLADVFGRLLVSSEPKIAVARVEDTSEYGRIEGGPGPEGPFLVRIVEKDGRHVPGLVNAGLYLLPRSIETPLNRLSPSRRGEIELPEALEREIESGVRFRIVEIGDWIDVGNLERLARAESWQRSRGGRLPTTP